MIPAPADDIERRIDAILVGAIDPHVHSGPSIAARGIDHLELAQDMSKAGFAAVITKDHDYSGVMTAALIARHHPDLRTRVYSSIVLNNVISGFNPYAVEHTAAMGGNEILDIIAKNDLALASGHIHISETWLVFEEAQRRGVTRMILTHPEEIVGASLNDVRGIAAMGAFVEHSLCMFLEGSKFKCCEEADLKKHVDAAGVSRTILCSDLGQTGIFNPLEGFRRGARLCIDLGYSDADVHDMMSTNAARAFGLEADVRRVKSGSVEEMRN